MAVQVEEGFPVKTISTINLELDWYCPWILDIKFIGFYWTELCWIWTTIGFKIQQNWTHF
jgi:hypothetical protein